MNHNNFQKPLVSVVMAVKNGEVAIGDAIQSILTQTYSNFELIVINDGSDDATAFIVNELKDPRIRVFTQKNRGVARSANRGIALAKGEFIARHDHDDISHPRRLEKQVEFMISNPNVALLGASAIIWEGEYFSGRFLDHPTSPEELKFELLFDNPFVHSSIIFRSEVVKSVGLYSPIQAITPLDDYDFISRVSRHYEVANLKERLVIYRETPKSLTSKFRMDFADDSKELQKKLATISANNLAHAIGMSAPDEICTAFGKLMHRVPQKLGYFQFRRVVGNVEKAFLAMSISEKSHSLRVALLRKHIDDLHYKFIQGLDRKYMHLLDRPRGGSILRRNYKKFFGIQQQTTVKFKSILILMHQNISTNYWVAREKIYFSLRLNLLLPPLRRLFRKRSSK